MIREIITYLTAKPTLASARSFGHLKESISLISRYKRCQKYWRAHRLQCHEFITNHLSEASHFESVLVLGARPLHEIPIEELALRFKRVVLVDIVHLGVTKKSVKHLKNVEFIEHEISETENVLQEEEKLLDKIPEKFLAQSWGLILSVNVMSQLPIHLRIFIEKKLKHKFEAPIVENFLKQVTANHLRYLKSFQAKAILITDTQIFYHDQKDALVHTHDNYPHLELPAPLAQWMWNVAPIPELQKDLGMKMKVCGFVLKNKNSH